MKVSHASFLNSGEFLFNNHHSIISVAGPESTDLSLST
jgi:hypothetical protein